MLVDADYCEIAANLVENFRFVRVSDGSKVPRTAYSTTAAERSGAGDTPKIL
jgi:hypothetical protein